MDEIAEVLQWIVSIAAGAFSSYALKTSFYWRDRNIELESRISKNEKSYENLESRLIEMFEKQDKQNEKLGESVKNIEKIVNELNVIVAVVKSKQD